MTHVNIIGAGLGGLSLALALSRAGHSATVFEQADAFGEVGAGIQLSPNATRALFSLGLEADVRAIGFAPEAAEVRDHAKRRLLLRNELGPSALDRWGAPYLQVHRADLHRVLLDATLEQGRTEFRLGTSLASLEGSTAILAGGERRAADALIGCDGLRSRVREALWGEGAPRFTGQTAWRGTVAADRLGAGLIRPMAQVWTGGARHFVHYPIRGGAVINFIAVTEALEHRFESWSEPGDKGALQAAFKGWPPSVEALIGEAETVMHWPLFDRPPLSRWSNGVVSLLGDAAHPMLPFLAQGAAMAIEDAVVLARRLASGGAVDAALVDYEAVRRPRTSKTQAWSRRNAALFHLPGPVATGVFGMAAAIDRLQPDQGARRFDWLYGYDAAAPKP
jgi:salicylate hydroxylase